MKIVKFSEKIVGWFLNNKRDLPWRNTDNPYFIWLSEILLQQTRVEQSLNYYNKFIYRFPEIKLLSEAKEEEILKLWQGLGYYSRARNLHFASKQIINDHNGEFPDKYEDILKLKGIGPYSAAAIASIAFQLPYPVIDGNVLRVISRIFGIETPVDTILGRKKINTILNDYIDKKDPGTFNQAVMELGALICKPQNPLCNDCVFLNECYAFNNNIVNLLPVKSKMVKQRDRFFYYLVITSAEKHTKYIYLNKRVENDIWKNLYDFPLIEKELFMENENIPSTIKAFLNSDDFIIKSISNTYKHKLSHQTIYACFVHLEIDPARKLRALNNYYPIDINNIDKYPVPKLIDNYIKRSLLNN